MRPNVDVMFRRGEGSIFRRPLPGRLTGDVVGTVESVGPDVDPRRLGRRVAALSEDAFADCAVADAQWLAPAPEGLDSIRHPPPFTTFPPYPNPLPTASLTAYTGPHAAMLVRALGDRLKSAADVLVELVQPSYISVHSNPGLVKSVDAASAQDDKARAERADEKLRRKPVLEPIAPKELDSRIELTPWEVLHNLGRAIALSRQGAGRGLAEHWGCLKYSQALTWNHDSSMTLSDEGRDTANYYKAIQSRELGIGFAAALARRLLRRAFPDHCVSIVPAETALRAGWESGTSSGYRYRPQFFAEIWQPGEPSRTVPIACKGNHGNAATSYNQLASASAHVEGIHIGAWDQTPALVFSTELPIDGALTVHALRAPGTGGRLRGPADSSPGTGLNHTVQDKAIYPGILPPTVNGNAAEREPGFHVQPENYLWFRQVLARTAAAGLGAFAGDGDTTARYLTKQQGQQRFTGFIHAAADSVQDANQTFLGTPFVGTDHIFRLNGTRVEAFSGVAKNLFDYLQEGRLERYRTQVYALRTKLPVVGWDDGWDGPVSVDQDGTVLAMRLLYDDAP
jgi:hypothetical protein